MVYSCLEVTLIPRNPEAEPQASFSGLPASKTSGAHLHAEIDMYRSGNLILLLLSLPTVPLLCHLLVHSSGILVPDVTSLFPLAGNLPFSHNPDGLPVRETKKLQLSGKTSN